MLPAAPSMPTPFRTPGNAAPTTCPIARCASSTCGWSWTWIWPARRLAGAATLTLPARRDGLAASSFDAVEHDDRRASRVDGRPPPLRLRRRAAAGRAAPSRSPAGRQLHGGDPLRCRPAPRPVLHRARTPTTRTARCSAGPRGRTTTRATTGRASTIPIEKATTEVICTAPARPVRAVERRAARAQDLRRATATRWHYALDFPQPAYLVTLVCGPFVEMKDRAPETGVDVYYFVPPGPRGRRPPQLRAARRR